MASSTTGSPSPLPTLHTLTHTPPPHPTPHPQALALIGEFNDWEPLPEHWAIRNDFGVWQLFLPDKADGTPAITHRRVCGCRLVRACVCALQRVLPSKADGAPPLSPPALCVLNPPPRPPCVLQDQDQGARGDCLRRVGGAHSRLDQVGHPGGGEIRGWQGGAQAAKPVVWACYAMLCHGATAHACPHPSAPLPLPPSPPTPPQEWNEIQYNGVYWDPPEVGAPGEVAPDKKYTFKYPRPPRWVTS